MFIVMVITMMVYLYWAAKSVPRTEDFYDIRFDGFPNPRV